MPRHSAFAFVVSLVLFAAAAAAGDATIASSWIRPDYSQGPFRKLAVIGISDDQQARHHFEDKFVSHLRGRDVGGVTSHSLIPDLQNVENRDQLVTRVIEEKIDGVISVRLVPLDKTSDEEWFAGWDAALETDSNLRMLVASTLPTKPTKAKRFGVEIAVWEIRNGYRVWAGRTDGHPLKLLQEQAGDLVQLVLVAMKEGGLL